MKLIVAIVQDEDASRLINRLMDEGFGVTKMATTGGFLRAGNVTLLVGVDDNKVEQALGLIEKMSKARTQMTTAPTAMASMTGTYSPYPVEVMVGGATVFVLPVEAFYKY